MFNLLDPSRYKLLMSLQNHQKQKQNGEILLVETLPSTTIKPQKSIQQASKQINESNSPMYEENKKLRRKLKQLSTRLDEQLQKAAEYKLKHLNDRNGHPVTLESQTLQLQNAYKMIERLQKAVKDFQSKQAYHVTLKRVMDLQGIIKKKEEEIEQLKTEIKTQKRIVKEKERYIQQLIQSSKKLGNPTEDLEIINKLKIKMKKVSQDMEILKRKELQKHQKLVKAERKIVELQLKEKQAPDDSKNSLLKQLDEYRNKYKDLVQRLQRQNIYIGKLNEKLNSKAEEKKKSKDKRHASLSLGQLPQIKKLKSAQLNSQLPSPKGSQTRRY